MPKVEYDGIVFDSELEVKYYQILKASNTNFIYHPKAKIKITNNNYYTPDFIVKTQLGYQIIETKGYNPYSKMKDDMIHQVMLAKTPLELRSYIEEVVNGMLPNDVIVEYRKIKYLKSYGFVDWNFKNPNSQINQARLKNKELKEDLKELSEFKKDTLRYFKYQFKSKLTKKQEEWKEGYLEKIKVEIGENDDERE